MGHFGGRRCRVLAELAVGDGSRLQLQYRSGEDDWHTFAQTILTSRRQGQRVWLGVANASMLRRAASPDKVDQREAGGGGGGRGTPTHVFFQREKGLWPNFHNGVGYHHQQRT